MIEGDTILALTIEQSKKVTKTFIKANHYETISDSLGAKIVLLNIRISNDSILLTDAKLTIVNLKSVIKNNKDVSNKLMNDLLETDRELRKVKNRSKLLKIGLVGSLVLNGILIVAMML